METLVLVKIINSCSLLITSIMIFRLHNLIWGGGGCYGKFELSFLTCTLILNISEDTMWYINVLMYFILWLFRDQIKIMVMGVIILATNGLFLEVLEHIYSPSVSCDIMTQWPRNCTLVNFLLFYIDSVYSASKFLGVFFFILLFEIILPVVSLLRLS